MADAVRTEVFDRGYDVLVHMTCVSDGTGEVDAIKIDKSTLAMPSTTTEPTSLRVLRCRWNVQGFSSVQFQSDRTTDVVLLVLAGSGYDDFSGEGLLDSVDRGPGVTDSGSGGTGDIVLTSIGASATATYDITLHCAKVA